MPQIAAMNWEIVEAAKNITSQKREKKKRV